MSKSTFTISALQPEDIPAAAEMADRAFDGDRQTQMKRLAEREPFDMKQHSLDSMPTYLKHPRCVVLKAIDNETGKLMGVCNWGFKGILPHEMPSLEGRVQPEELPKPKEDNSKPSEEGKKPEPEKEKEEQSSKTSIQRLEELTGGDMDRWMEKIMPEGARCMYIVGLNVSPEFQGKGVGSALLQWGKDVCDEKGIYAWVHSSEPAWKMYEKSGFKIIEILDVDLDEYAPCPPPGEGEGAKWGHYVFRYMQYYPKK